MTNIESDNSLERISKLDAARQQLATAIEMFFCHADSVSVHTLACMANTILSDLGKKRKIQSMKNANWIRPEKYDEFITILNKPQNFFKHADRDPESILDFRPTITPFYILDGLRIYENLKHDLFLEGRVFIMWFIRKYPDLVNNEALQIFLNEALLGISQNDLHLFSECLTKLKQKTE